MPLILTVSQSKKIGEPNYGSKGASVTLQIEVDSSMANDPSQLQQQIRELFQQSRAAVEQELFGRDAPPAEPHNDSPPAMDRWPKPSTKRHAPPASATTPPSVLRPTNGSAPSSRCGKPLPSTTKTSTSDNSKNETAHSSSSLKHLSKNLRGPRHYARVASQRRNRTGKRLGLNLPAACRISPKPVKNANGHRISIPILPNRH